MRPTICRRATSRSSGGRWTSRRSGTSPSPQPTEPTEARATGAEFRAGARRLGILVAALAGITVAGSLLIGLGAGARLSRSLATGFYVAAAALLIGCFVVGVRGPLRPDWGAGGRGGGSFIPKGVRQATTDERRGSVRTSLLLFALGIVFVVVGSLIDPDRRAF